MTPAVIDTLTYVLVGLSCFIVGYVVGIHKPKD